MYTFQSTVIPSLTFSLFFFNDTATTEIYTLSLHDALPIYAGRPPDDLLLRRWRYHPGQHTDRLGLAEGELRRQPGRSEEHTSELQSHLNLVCRLLLEKKKMTRYGLTIDDM